MVGDDANTSVRITAMHQHARAGCWFAVDSPLEDRRFELPVPRRRDNRRDLSQLSAAAAFSAVAERTGLNAGCPSAFEEAAALYSLRTQRPDPNCKAVRKAWATAC